MSAQKPSSDDSQEQLQVIAESLDQIRRLLIYALIRNGASQGDVASALGITQSTVSKLLASSAKTTRRRN